MSAAKSILVTTALPYANGPIHLGHLLEHIQTDIWVRFQRQFGHDCIYVCADDAHGTATMLSAERAGVAILTWIEEVRRAHERDLRAFGISYDNYHSTHSAENKQLSERIYTRLSEKGHLRTRVIKQFYDAAKKMFLADRFICGRCPKCDTPDQYGDNCEACSSTYDALELKDPISRLSGERPIIKESEHLFFHLPAFTDYLRQWVASGTLQPEVRNKLQEWFAAGLQEWDISRDAPYFGFVIPGYTNKYFYVWLDAPIGYMASFANLCAQKDWDFEAEWRTRAVYHFIGKDIMYFHCLFWPAMLAAAGYASPKGVWAHGFVTVNGAKMSKSRGTFIAARDYLDHLEPEYIRYYFATKLTSGLDDMDFNFGEFDQRVNSDLVGKMVNIASRCARFINANFANRLATDLDETQNALLQELVDGGDQLAAWYDERNFARVIRRILEYADQVNRYLDQVKPWDLARTNASDPRIQQIATAGLACYRQLAIYIQPVMPELAARSARLLRETDWNWQDRLTQPWGKTIAPFVPLLQRIKQEDIAKLTRDAA